MQIKCQQSSAPEARLQRLNTQMHTIIQFVCFQFDQKWWNVLCFQQLVYVNKHFRYLPPFFPRKIKEKMNYLAFYYIHIANWILYCRYNRFQYFDLFNLCNLKNAKKIKKIIWAHLRHSNVLLCCSEHLFRWQMYPCIHDYVTITHMHKRKHVSIRSCPLIWIWFRFADISYIFMLIQLIRRQTKPWYIPLWYFRVCN